MEMAKKSQLYRNYRQKYGELLRQTEKANFKNSHQKRNTDNYLSERTLKFFTIEQITI